MPPVARELWLLVPDREAVGEPRSVSGAFGKAPPVGLCHLPAFPDRQEPAAPTQCTMWGLWRVQQTGVWAPVGSRWQDSFLQVGQSMGNEASVTFWDWFKVIICQFPH